MEKKEKGKKPKKEKRILNKLNFRKYDIKVELFIHIKNKLFQNNFVKSFTQKYKQNFFFFFYNSIAKLIWGLKSSFLFGFDYRFSEQGQSISRNNW